MEDAHCTLILRDVARVKLIRSDFNVEEGCALCDKPTVFWYPYHDIPLCMGCAAGQSHKGLPAKRQWLTRLGFNLPEGWVPNL